jgi:hypothetical protein
MDQEMSLDAVQLVMSKHFRLNYDIFDENAAEKVDKKPLKLNLLLNLLAGDSKFLHKFKVMNASNT